jgi:hypothetical protein
MEKVRRDVNRLVLEQALAALNAKIFIRDQYTFQRFRLVINTSFVRVLTLPPVPEYIGLPIGFLPDNEVIVWNVTTEAINIVKLNQLANHGTKRRKIHNSDRAPSPVIESEPVHSTAS